MQMTGETIFGTCKSVSDMHSRQELAGHLGGKAFQAASSAMEASML